MEIKILPVGDLETNCYLLVENNECFIIDPGDELDKIVEEIDTLIPVGIGITHYHYDHIGALSSLKEKYNLPVFDFNMNGKIECNSFSFEIVPFPGHKDDLVGFYFTNDNCMFTGDFLFYHTVGRIDLPGGNREDMISSIDKIKKYPSTTNIYPGHGIKTTILEEIENNSYFTHFN